MFSSTLVLDVSDHMSVDCLNERELGLRGL